MSINVAIDGPAGAGKSSIARAAAARLGYIYVDTGALYRTVGVAALRRGLAPDDAAAVAKLLPEIRVALDFVDGEQQVLLNGENVSAEIRTPEASMAASKVSAIPAVRDFLFDLQKRIAASQNVLMDGRDIGTVVLPDAQVKLYLTASSAARAERRTKELREKGMPVEYAAILRDIEQRDYDDTHRAIAPLRQADDAIRIDTTALTLAESIDAVVETIRAALAQGKE